MNSSFSSLWFLIRNSQINQKIIVFASLVVLSESLVRLLYPLAVQELVKQSNSADAYSISFVSILCLAMIGGALLSGLSVLVLGKIGQNFIKNSRLRLYGRLLHVGAFEIEQGRAAEPVSRLIGDTKEVSGFVSYQLSAFLSGSVTLVITAVVLLFVDVYLTLLLYGYLIVVLLIILPIAKKMTITSRNIQGQEAAIVGRMAEVFSNVRLLKASGAEQQEQQIATCEINNLSKESVREIKIAAILAPITSTAFSIALIGIFVIGLSRVENGSISLGNLIVFVLYLINSITPIVQLANFMGAMSRAAGASSRLVEMESIEAERFSGISFDIENKDILIRDLKFFYPEQSNPALFIDELLIPAKKMTALVGRSGSGKSTLFALLNRIYESEGIFCADTAIEKIDLKHWRRQIGSVFQSNPVLLGSVRFNLNYGLELNASDSACIDALKHVQLWDLFSLQQGLDTNIGENGVDLSGGQKQRLAIARAIIRQPKLLMLDEATSALDTNTEGAVITALNPIIKGLTTIVAAHRLSTIIEADQIVVLQDGKVVGLGIHSHLLQSCPYYLRLFREQLFSDQAVI